MQSNAQNDRSAAPKGRAVATHQAKNTCPWGEEGADSPKSKSKKILFSSSSNTCPWSEGSTGEAQNAPRKNVAPAPWDNMQSEGGFGGQKKSGKSNQPTSLWDPEEDDSSRFQRGSYTDHSTELLKIQEQNLTEKKKNAASKNDGIF